MSNNLILNGRHVIKRFLNGAKWSLLSAVLTQGLMLLAFVMAARLVSKDDYGKFIFVQSTINTIGLFIGMGAGATAIRYVSEFKQKDRIRLSKILTLKFRILAISGLLATLGFYFGSDLLGRIIDRSIGSYALLIGMASAFLTIDAFFKSVLIGLESYRGHFFSSLSGILFSLPAIVSGGYFFGATGLIYSLLISYVAQALISWIVQHKELKAYGITMNYEGSVEEWRIIRDFSLPSMLSGMLVLPAHWICQILLSKLPDGLHQVAIFGICMQWFGVIMFAPMVVTRVVGPMLTEYVTNNNGKDSRKVILFSVFFNGLVSLPFAMCISYFSSYIIGIYGQEYISGSRSLAWAAWAGALLAIQSPIANIISARSKMWQGMAMNFGWFVVYLMLSYSNISLGSAGIFFALFVAYIFHSFWTVLFAYFYASWR